MFPTCVNILLLCFIHLFHFTSALVISWDELSTNRLDLRSHAWSAQGDRARYGGVPPLSMDVFSLLSFNRQFQRKIVYFSIFLFKTFDFLFSKELLFLSISSVSSMLYVYMYVVRTFCTYTTPIWPSSRGDPPAVSSLLIYGRIFLTPPYNTSFWIFTSKRGIESFLRVPLPDLLCVWYVLCNSNISNFHVCTDFFLNSFQELKHFCCSMYIL